MSHSIQEIVELLRQPPFNRASEGLVEFSKKSPVELLQVVNDVFALIDDRQRRDLRDEAKDAQTQRMLEFVTVLGYKFDGDAERFGTQFMSGATQVVYPFLLWCLHNFEKNKTRGYLARYLRPFSIPEEHFADNQIVNLFQQYQARQSEFKEQHMQLEEVRRTASNPTHLQSEVTQLENEKEQLVNKLEKLRARIANDSDMANVNFDEMLAVTNQLRQGQEAEAKLYQDLQEQRQKLQRAEATRIATSKAFQELNHSDVGRMDPQKLLQKLRDDVAARRNHLETRVEPAIAEKEKALKQLSKVASSSSEYTADDLGELLRTKADLQESLGELHQRRENAGGAGDSKVSFVRDRLANVEKKRAKLEERVSEALEEKKDAEAELSKLQAEFKSLLSSSSDSQPLPDGRPRPKTDAQMKEYTAELSRRTAKYKSMKGELEGARTEVAVLQRTEEILRGRDGNIKEFNEEQEKRLGVEGYTQLTEQTESVSLAKNALDASKGATLETTSDIVEKINASLKRKKDKLTPQIKELRAVRSEFEAIEAVYRSKKNIYENLSLGFESERIKLEQDVASHHQGIGEEESQYHLLHCLNAVTQARLEQVAREAKEGDKNTTSVKDQYERAISDQESVTKALRNEKKRITEKHDDHVAQRSMFRALSAILNRKLDITKNPDQGSAPQGGHYGGGAAGGFGQSGQQQSKYGSQQQGSGSSSYLDQLAEESDRLVLEQ